MAEEKKVICFLPVSQRQMKNNLCVWPALGLYNLPWERNWGGPTTPDRAYSAPGLVNLTMASDPPRLQREVWEVFGLGLAFAVLFSPQSFTSTVSGTSSSTELRQPSLAQISQISTINLIPQCHPSSHPLPLILCLPFCLLGSAVVGCVSLYTLAMQMPICECMSLAFAQFCSEIWALVFNCLTVSPETSSACWGSWVARK